MMKPYEKYTQIDEKWFTEYPSHWEVKRIKEIFNQRTERNEPVKTTNILSLSAKNGVLPISEKTDKGGNKPKEDITKYNVARENDLLVNCMNIVSGAAGVSKWAGAISPVYYALFPRTEQINIWLYHNVFRLSSFQKSLLGLGKGILMIESSSGKLNTVRMRIPMSNLNNVMLPVPPRTEQNQIVRFLDWQLSKINKLIKAKKKQIALFNDQKKSIINCAVTMGGNGWKEISLGNLGDFRKGFGGSREDDKEDGAACIRYGDIYRVGALSLSHPITTISLQSTGFYSRVYKDEMLFALSGETKDEIGQALVNNIENDTWTSGDTGIFTANSEVLPRFLSYALRCPYVVKQRASLAKGDIIVHISTGALKQLRILIPPISEQEAIIVNLDQKCNVIEKLIEHGYAQIALLNEYQTSLVSSVVTGKVDVRNVVVPEMDIIDDGEITDDDIEASEVDE